MASERQVSWLVALFYLVIWFCNSLQGDAARKYEFMKEATDAAPTGFYDYIVVGGGTAGCPLAATLSQNFSVLLLERGGSPYGNINITRVENFHINLADVSPTSPSQFFVSEEGVVNSRARVLGGGSAINAGFYSRASPRDVSKKGWDGELVNQSFPWVERVVAHKPEMKPWQKAVKSALLEVGVSPYNGFTYDHVFGTKEGGTIFDQHGNRHTAADLLVYAHPQNLTVLLHATVERLLFLQGNEKITAHGVVYKDAEGHKHEAYLKNGESEIIVSAGALGSPQLLMLSGIGPKEHLKSMGIPVVLDQPNVGQGMGDNPMNAICIPTTHPVEKSLLQVVGITKFGSYIEASSGFGTTTQSIHKHLETIRQKISRGNFKAKTMSKPHKRVVFSEKFQGAFIMEKIMGPLSRGRLALMTTNVEDNPTVAFNYFQEPGDLKRCVMGIKTIEKMIKTRHFNTFINSSLSVSDLRNLSAYMAFNLIPKQPNDTTRLDQFCKDSVTTIWHYHGGCQVGKVVDRNYRVYGVQALRIVDGSTFTFSPGTNPQATVMMMGRYMGVKFLRERLGAAAGV